MSAIRSEPLRQKAPTHPAGSPSTKPCKGDTIIAPPRAADANCPLGQNLHPGARRGEMKRIPKWASKTSYNLHANSLISRPNIISLWPSGQKLCTKTRAKIYILYTKTLYTINISPSPHVSLTPWPLTYRNVSTAPHAQSDHGTARYTTPRQPP